jgi:hypothetical protein
LSVLSFTSYFVCVVTHLFECIVILVTDKLDSSFLYKGPSSTSVKLFFSVSAQPQLLEVRRSGDVSILSRNSLHLMFLFDLLIYFLSFLWFLYYCENWIELNYVPLSLHLNTKSQISLYISNLDSLHSCTLLTLKYYYLRAFKVVSTSIFVPYSYSFFVVLIS